MAPRTALPLLLSLTFMVYWRSNFGDYIEETELLLRRNVRRGVRRPA